MLILVMIKRLINLREMKTLVTEELYQYSQTIAREETELIRELRRDSVSTNGAHMQITPEQGQFMALLAQLTGAKKYLEIGVFTGLSALVMTSAMGDGAKTIGLENDPRPLAVARKYWDLAGLNNIEIMLDDALISLKTLVTTGHINSFDVAFIDAKKSDYIEYFEYCLKLVRAGGVILIDNIFLQGRVLNDNLANKTRAICEFNQFIKTDSRVDYCVMTIADGMIMARKKD